MTWLPDLFGSLLGRMSAAELLVHLAMQSTVVVVLGLLVTRLASNASAASRHLVWILAFSALVVVPVLVWVWPLEPIRVAFAYPPPAFMQAGTNDDPVGRPGFIDQQLQHASDASRTEENGADVRAPDAEDAGVDRQLASPIGSTATPWVWAQRVHAWAPLMFAGWMLGVVFFCCLILAGHLKMSKGLRSFRAVNDHRLLEELERAREILGVRRGVRLFESGHDAIPMTWGVLAPAIAVPPSANSWSDERVRMVLLHEMAHVRRLDCLWQSLALATVAIYWFNPLVWIAASRMRSECEQSCDDEVLSSGVQGADYAEQILDISTGGRRGVLALCAGLAMARSHGLAERVRAIVDEGCNRNRVSRRRLVGSVAATMLLAVPVASLTNISVDAGAGEPRLSSPSRSNGTPTQDIRASRKQPVTVRSQPLVDAVVRLDETPTHEASQGNETPGAGTEGADEDGSGGDDGSRSCIYVLDRQSGGSNLTLIADENTLPGRGFLGSPTMSHDGNWVVFDATKGSEFSQTRLVKMAIAGPRKGDVVDLGYGVCGSYSPDDTQIAFFLNNDVPSGEERGVWVMDADGSNRRRVTNGCHPHWSPDGKSLLTVTRFRSPRQLTLVEVATGKRTRLLRNEIVLGQPAWSPDGQQIAIMIQDGEDRVMCVVRPQRESSDRRDLWRQTLSADYDESWPDWSPDGKSLVFTDWYGKSGGILITDMADDSDGKPQRADLIQQTTRIRDCQWTADGKRILFASDSDVVRAAAARF